MNKIFLGLFILLVHPTLFAATVTVIDHKGKPVKDAVVYLKSSDSELKNSEEKPTHSVVQMDRQFTPFVNVVAVGTEVDFPNKDTIAHHVYSFSKPKAFELKLYKGTETERVLMDQPGVVVLGCNIHDWMVSYLYVVDAQFFATTDQQGQVTFNDLSQGSYELHVWHPGKKGKGDYTRQWADVTVDQEVQLKLKASYLWKPAIPDEGGNY